MEELGLDNILNDEDIENLFVENSTEEVQETSPENKEEKKETTEDPINVETLFENPESVGSEETQEGKDTSSDKETGSSPNNNFYSSIAKALKEEGVFPDLEDNVLDNVKEPEDFVKLIEDQVQSRYDEGQKRINDALNADIEPSVIRQYENTISYLDNIKEDDLTAEGESGENLRKQVIYQDLINKGYSKDDALDEINDIFESGTDVKRAKRALNSNKEFFQRQYQKLIDDAEEAKEKEVTEREQQTENLRKELLNKDTFFGDIKLDKSVRQKVFDNINKPVYKDKKSGELFTALQKYEMENKTEFLKNVGLLFTLTDGFKNLDALVKNKVKKEVKKGVRDLENILSTTSRNSNGNLQFVTGVTEEPEGFARSWDIDI